ncbi:MAG: hypothetical protein IJX44_04965 [Bacteroidaceae bacterium]|nr:hypothetical protein [Bacteroidaceae bacterium]
MAKNISRKEQRREQRARREEEQGMKVMKWVFTGLAILALIGIVWAACM